MMDSGGDERREFFRIADNLLIELRQVTSEEAEALKKSLLHESVAPAISTRLRNIPSIPDDIHSYLISLENKLDLIIDILSGREKPFERKFVETDISGSGIKYQSDTKIEEGVFVELRIEFAFSQQQKITVLGKVIRSKEVLVDGKNVWDTAINFVAMNDKNRDSLINYVFSRERQHIQSMKESLH